MTHFIRAAIMFFIIVATFAVMISFPNATNIFFASLAVGAIIVLIFGLCWSVTE